MQTSDRTESVKQLDHRQARNAFLGGVFLILLGLSGAGFFSYLAWVTGDLAGVLRKAGWFTLAGILASLISGFVFFRAALRREFPVPVAKRVVRAITALFLAAFLLSEGSLLGLNDK